MSYFGFTSGTAYSAPQSAAYAAAVSASAQPASYVPPAAAPAQFSAAASSVVPASYTYTAAPTAYPAAAAAAAAAAAYQMPSRPQAAQHSAGSGQAYTPAWTTAPSYQSFTASTATPAVPKAAPPPPPPIPSAAPPKMEFQAASGGKPPTGGYSQQYQYGYTGGSAYAPQQHAGPRPPQNQQQYRGQQQRRPYFTPRRPYNQQQQSQQPQQQQQQAPHHTASLHYCDVCKISCAGPQTFKEHLEGQKHKKREAAAKRQQEESPKPGQKQLRCELCDVTCTGADAYASHIRGSKHLKTAKLHTRLGKSLPSADPIVVCSRQASDQPAAAAAAAGEKQQLQQSPAPVAKRVVAAPKIGFVPGSALKSVGAEELAEDSAADAAVDAPKTDQSQQQQTSAAATAVEQHVDLSELQEREYVAPVGYEYIDELLNDQGKAVQFHCKLCDCKFNDPHAKEMHLKGRRHRLQYKRKVDPSLEVDIKPSVRARRHDEQPAPRAPHGPPPSGWAARRQMMEAQMMEWSPLVQHPYQHHHRSLHGILGPRRAETSDDRHVAAKLASLAQPEADRQALVSLAARCERALRQVSEQLDAPATQEGDKGEQQQQQQQREPVLKGVMRVGAMAKGLHLNWDRQCDLVLLCTAWPTRALAGRLLDLLPAQMCPPDSDEPAVSVQLDPDSCGTAFLVACTAEGGPSCRISLTSPAVRESDAGADCPTQTDLLDKEKCLEALAHLRRAKWFQAKASDMQSCTPVIRIMRDLCRRVNTWTPLPEWAIELLVEKCISSNCVPLSPGDALRRVFECLASGLLLPGGPGLQDPCEKELVDAAECLTAQERENLTASAQYAMRLIAFRQLHRVLDMPPLAHHPAGGHKRSAAAAAAAAADAAASGNGDENTAGDGEEGGAGSNDEDGASAPKMKKEGGAGDS